MSISPQLLAFTSSFTSYSTRSVCGPASQNREMKYPVLLGALLFGLLSQPFASAIDQAASNIRSIYLFKDVMKSNTTSLKTSGFNTVVIFGVGILGNGDIMV